MIISLCRVLAKALAHAQNSAAVQLPLRCHGQSPNQALRLALDHLRSLAKSLAEQEVEADGAERAASAVVQRWGAWLSVALHRANAAVLWSAVRTERGRKDSLAVRLAS